jgi:hypothetical protein
LPRYYTAVRKPSKATAPGSCNNSTFTMSPD